MERTSARAIILTKDSKLILIHRKWRGKEYWVTPGGGVEKGESLQNALVRELQEEVGITISVGHLVLEVVKDVDDIHSIQKFFECQHISGEIGSGMDKAIKESTPDNFSEVVLVDQKEAKSLNIVPKEAKKLILEIMMN